MMRRREEKELINCVQTIEYLHYINFTMIQTLQKSWVLFLWASQAIGYHKNSAPSLCGNGTCLDIDVANGFEA